MFHVGQKVERIGGEDAPEYIAPPIGSISTVANVYTADNGHLQLELVEWPSPETDELYAGFKARFFRPIVEKKTDISCFTAMLTPAPARSRELCGSD